MTIQDHRHSWLGGDASKISFNDLRDKPSLWNVKTIKFTRAASVWTWNQSFTWFGFTPSHYNITAWRDATWEECVSHSWRDINWLSWGVSIRPLTTWWISESANTTSVIRILFTNAWGGDTRATHVSLDSDGITVNFLASAEDIQFQLTCYW